MGLGLKSVLKNQILKLAYKFAILTALIFSYEHTLDLTYLILFGFLLALFYLRPGVQNGQFVVPILSGFFLVLAIPPSLESEIYVLFSMFMGLLFTLILGIKNHAFLMKQQVYAFVNLSLACLFSIFFFYGFLDTKFDFGLGISSMVLFGAVFLLFRDLKIASFPASFAALILLEISWVLSILPINHFLKGMVAIMAIGALWFINLGLINSGAKRII